MQTNPGPQLSESHLLTTAFQENRSLVVLVTYAGKRYVRIRKVTQYNILLNVSGASVLIYKHGIHELKNYRTQTSN